MKSFDLGNSRNYIASITAEIGLNYWIHLEICQYVNLSRLLLRSALILFNGAPFLPEAKCPNL